MTLVADHLYLIAAEGGPVRLFRIDAELRPVELPLAAAPRHGRGSLGHGYTDACDPTGEQCNNSQCRMRLAHHRCAPACSGETYWDDLGPWQIAPERRADFTEALGRTSPV